MKQTEVGTKSWTALVTALTIPPEGDPIGYSEDPGSISLERILREASSA